MHQLEEDEQSEAVHQHPIPPTARNLLSLVRLVYSRCQNPGKWLAKGIPWSCKLDSAGEASLPDASVMTVLSLSTFAIALYARSPLSTPTRHRGESDPFLFQGDGSIVERKVKEED